MNWAANEGVVEDVGTSGGNGGRRESGDVVGGETLSSAGPVAASRLSPIGNCGGYGGMGGHCLSSPALGAPWRRARFESSPTLSYHDIPPPVEVCLPLHRPHPACNQRLASPSMIASIHSLT